MKVFKFFFLPTDQFVDEIKASSFLTAKVVFYTRHPLYKAVKREVYVTSEEIKNETTCGN